MSNTNCQKVSHKPKSLSSLRVLPRYLLSPVMESFKNEEGESGH